MGSWSLAARDVNGASLLDLPVELDVAAVLKASNRYAAYLFDDAVFDGVDGAPGRLLSRIKAGRLLTCRT